MFSLYFSGFFEQLPVFVYPVYRKGLSLLASQPALMLAFILPDTIKNFHQR